MNLFAKIPSRHMPDHDTPILFKLNGDGDVFTGCTQKSAEDADGYRWWTSDYYYETSKIEWWIYLSDVTKLIRVET